VGEGINPDEIIEIKSDISILYQLIHSLRPLSPLSLTPPPPVPAPPLPAPSPPSPPSSPKTVQASPPPLRRHKSIKYGFIAILSTIIAYIAVTYGLFFIVLTKANNFNPGTGASLDQSLQQIATAQARFQKLNLISSFDTFFAQQSLHTQKRLRLLQAEHLGAEAFSMMLGVREGDIHKTISQTKLILDQVYELESTTPADPDHIHQLESLRHLLLVYPQIVPPDKKITLLVLLQNNLELRPTGGFISSVALMTFDRGKLLNTETRNIYDLDSNLRGQVQPPTEITQYLGESSWYFRDSNWNPDFAQSATSANWFLEKEWGSRADLVIGLNPNSLKSLLASTGSLTLTSGVAVNADNLLVTLLNSQDSAASTAQPEMISQIFTALMSRLNQADPSTHIAVLKSLYDSFIDGEITLMSTNPRTQLILDDQRLSGSVYAPLCTGRLPGSCYSDHFYLNEANVGINKANYYLARQINHQTSLLSNNLLHTHTLEIQNQSPSDIWPAGKYKAYYRLFIPLDAFDITITINNQQLNPNQLSLSAHANLRLVGWYQEIPAQSRSSLIIAYKLPLTSTLNSYQFFLQKQPGQLPTNYTYTFSGPGLPQTYSGTLSRHLTIPIEFSP
jgi:hypothetical protein